MTPTNDIVRTQPPVVKWFRVYCGVLFGLYLCMVPASWFFFLASPPEMPAAEVRFMALLMLATAFVFAAAFVVPFLVDPRPWLWGYGIGLICIGMTSTCLLPVCVLLLIYWIKPETKRYFGKRDGVTDPI